MSTFDPHSYRPETPPTTVVPAPVAPTAAPVSTQRRGARTGALLLGTAALALGGGYLLGSGGNNFRVQAQTVPQPVKEPVVQTASTRDASAIQDAFAQVSSVIGPAVVTIQTSSAQPAGGASPSNPFGRRNPFGMPGPGGGGDNNQGGDDPFEEFFKQFEQKYNFRPNSAQHSALKNQFIQVQAQRRGNGLGSGMIFRPDGYILTNAHVVKGADAKGITVTLADEREFKRAKLIGIDEKTDIAVIKIDATNLPTVKLGDSDDVKVGDWAIAIGNPYGLDHSMTVGVVSAKAREVALSERNSSYIQTDASINPGNSGGPLCDINGRVIGVNNAIYSQSGGNVGIGFAIPVNMARQIANELVKSGKIVRGYLGVEIVTLDAEQAAQFGLPENTRGVMVRNVTPNTPGARAGLQRSDVILSFNGKKVTKSNELQSLVGAAPVGSNARLEVLRDGQTINLTARLDQLPNETPSSNAPTAPDREEEAPIAGGPELMGMTLRSITPDLSRRFNLVDARGVLVTNVAPNSAAANAGIKRGDVIERVGQRAVTTPQALQQSVRDILARQKDADTKSVALLVNRGGQRNFLTLETEN